MFKSFRERFQKLEFSQKLCVYVMVGYALFSLIIIAVTVFLNPLFPIVDIFDKTIILPIIEVGAYAGMKGAENVQKIIKSKAESLLKISTDGGVNSNDNSTNTPV